MWPADTQTVADNNLLPFALWNWWWEIVWTDAMGTGTFDCNRAVILCHPDTPLHPPAAFIARFPGGREAEAPMKITGSGRVSENIFTSEPEQYQDEPVLVYTTAAGVTKLMLAQELQSTGDDIFVPLMRTGLQPTPGMDTHRLEAVEPLLRRGAGTNPGTATLTVAPVTSNILDAANGSPGTGYVIPSLEATSQPVRAPIGQVQSARWLGFTLFGDNTNCVFRYLGAILRGRRLS